MPLGGGSWPFCFGPEKTQKREESSLKNFCIPIFLTVAQDEPYKILVTCFSERFSEIILKMCVNDSFQKEKPSRSKLSPEGQNKFELNHYNIIHATADTSKHFINIFETLPDGTNKTANGKNKRPGYSRKFNMADMNGWSFCSLLCERLCRFSPLETCFIFILWLKGIALFGNLIAQPTYCKNKT